MKLIRVLIIEDSAFMRKMITDILSSNKMIEVVGTARNGLDGLSKIESLNPDVVTLDVEMPVMDGIETLENIMNTKPLPVVMLSSVTSKGASKTIEAMSIGAVDFITKPSGSISLDINESKQEIIDKVVQASKINMSTTSTKAVSTKSVSHRPIKKMKPQALQTSIVAIGTSTGGPRALQNVLTRLPEDFPAPILIVQHMPPNFTKSLADRLNRLAKIEVKEAVHGELIQPGVAYIAPGDYHMKTRRVGRATAIELTKGAAHHGHRPAVDVLFDSIAALRNMNKVIVILTGMGRDGAEGIKEIKNHDKEAIIFAESKESSIVYGMPAAAVETGYVNQVIHLDQIGEMVKDLLNSTRR